MTAQETLAAAIDSGVFLYVEDGRLKYRAPAGALASELKDGLREHRDDIVRHLSRVQAAAADEHLAPPPLRKRAPGGRVPLSFAQQRLWFIDRLGEGSVQYHVGVSYRLTGRLDLDSLARALSTIVERHESLRTVIGEEGGVPYQELLRDYPEPLAVRDLSALAPELQELEIRRAMSAEGRPPFDLGRDLMLRAELLTLSAEAHVLLLEMHHIATDGWSQVILRRELVALYTAYSEGRPNPLPPAPVQYADYTVWQRDWLQGEVLARQLGFWCEALEGIPDVHGIPLDHERPAKPTHAGGVVRSRFGPELLGDIRALCRRHDVTLPMFLQTAVSVLFARYSGDTDVVMGMPVPGRVHLDLEPVIGFFVNTLVLRTRLEGNPAFTGVLERNRQHQLDAMTHQHVPFEMIVEALRPRRAPGHTPVFQILFNVQPSAQHHLALPGLTLEPLGHGSRTSKFDLVINVSEGADELSVDIGYSTEIFQHETIARMAASLGVLLQSAVAAPEAGVRDLELLTAEQRHRLLHTLNEGRDAGVFILDGDGRLVPEGGRGELCLGPDPEAARAHRTGKAARWSPAGEIEVLGSLDDHVTLGNRRVDIAGFRAVLAQAPGVAGFATAVRRDAEGREVLVAYVTDASDEPRLDDLRAALAAALAPEELPFAVVAVDRLPAAGDGEAMELLPVPGPSAPAFRGPSTETERRMERVWRTLLPDATLDVRANFFAVGGHSLSMIVLMKRIAGEFGVDIPLATFIENPTIEAAAGFVDGESADSPAEGTIPAADPLADQALRTAEAGIRPLSEEQRAGPLRVSLVQATFWTTTQQPARRTYYNIPGASRVTGPLCTESLRRAFQGLVARHSILRTVYRRENDFLYQFINPAGEFPLPVIDASGLTPEEQESRLVAEMHADAQRPFDLAADLPLRATLIRFSEEHHALLFNMHHIATDGWSYGVLKRELGAFYAAHLQGREAELPPLPVQYCDYAAWQRGPLMEELIRQEVKYFTGVMRGVPEVHGLPLDRPRPAEPSYRGDIHTATIDAERIRKLEALARSRNGTLFAALHALFALLVHRLSGDTDVVVGVPVVNRLHTEFLPLIGCFTNTIVLRSNLADSPRFDDFLGTTAESALKGFAHQGTPFGMVARALYPDRTPVPSLFQLMFSLQPDDEGPPFELPGLKLRQIEAGPTLAGRDLTVRARRSPSGVRMVWEYATDLFDAGTIAHMAAAYDALLDGVLRSPEERVDRLPLPTR